MNEKTRDEKYLRLCLELAETAASKGEVPVGAVIVNTTTGKILAQAHNLRERLNTPLGHAELIAIHRASQKLGQWRLTGYTLYCSLEPCVMCSGTIIQSRLDRVVYSATDPKGGGQSLFDLLNNPKLNHRVEVSQGQLQKESETLLKNFFKARRR